MGGKGRVDGLVPRARTSGRPTRTSPDRQFRCESASLGG